MGWFPLGISGIATGWAQLPIGGGGFATGLDMQSDGTKLARTNTGGAYKWNGSAWVQLVTDALPSAVWSNNQTMGVMELVAAPSATSTLYMHYFGYMLKSTDGGQTWSNLTGWTKDSDLSNAGSAQFGAVGPLIAVDPQNPNIVFAGSNNTGASGGLYKSTDGGTTWVAVSTVAKSSSYICVAFDPTSSVVGGAKQGIYAASNGTGVYHSTDGGATWTLTSSGPTAVIGMTVDVNGNVWCADLTVWKYNGTTWSHTYSTNDQNGYFYVAVDPNNSAHIFAVTLTGNLNVSLNTGTSWSGPAGTGLPSPTVSSSDVPWLASTAQGFMTIGKIAFDPSLPTRLYAAAGTGVFYIDNPPTSSVTTTALNWTDQTAGQETLVANVVLAPPSGVPNVFCWDRPGFRITSLSAYTNSETAFPSIAPIGAWAADWATGAPSTLVALISQSFSVDGQDHSGISTDGGQTWTKFATLPTLIGDGAWDGGIAAGGATNFMYIQGATSGLPSYTANSGASWAPITGTSLPTDGWTTNGVSNRRLCADRVTANTFYIANNGATPGIYTCTGGACVRTSTSLPDSGEPLLTSVPGNAGHIFGNFVAHSVQFSTNGGSTWTSITKFAGGLITALGFGAIFPGKSYPSIYMVGTDSSGTYGVWRSTDFNTGTGIGTWTNLGYPLNSFNEIQWIDGDKTIPQRVYLATNGNGALTGYFP